MAVVGDNAATAVGLLFEEVEGRNRQCRDLDHQVIQTLIFAAIEAGGELVHKLAKKWGDVEN